MRPDRPESLEEELEQKDDRRLRRRARRAVTHEPPILQVVRSMVMLETDDYVTVDGVAGSLGVPRNAVGVCMPHLVEEGLLREHAVLPEAAGSPPRFGWFRSPLSVMTIGGKHYAMRDGMWRSFTPVKNGRVGRTSRHPGSNRNRPEWEAVWTNDGDWDGRGFEIVRGVQYAAVSRSIGLGDSPVGQWTCCGESHRWDEKECTKCWGPSPRMALLGRGGREAPYQGPAEPEMRDCARCGGRARVKRRDGKVVKASHSRSVCNAQIAGHVLSS